MSLTDTINKDIKAAMLAKEKEKLAALRAIKAALLLEATKGGDGEINEDVEFGILKKLHKQRKDAANIYVEQDRPDLAEEETFQAGIIKEYLPEEIPEEEVEKVVAEVIAQVGASGPQDMGKVMGPTMGRLKGKADGSVISSVVKRLLNN